MQADLSDVVVVLVFGTVILLSLAFFIILFIFFFRQRQIKHRAEKQALYESYQREILQAQIETQNQTLQHVAEELHDNVGQLLSVVSLQLSVLDDDLNDTQHQPSIQQTGSLVSQAITDLRSLSKSLNSDALNRLGLCDSITLELERIHRTGRYQTHLLVSGELPPLDKQVEVVLLRMVQESLSNALKHARAQTLTVSLDGQPNTLTVRIADDGQGFKPELQLTTTSGSGLHNLKRRATLLGGTCTWQSQPGGGTTVTISLPLT